MRSDLAFEDWKVGADARDVETPCRWRSACSLCRDLVAERYPEQAVGGRLDAMHAHRFDGGKRQGLAGAKVEARSVERAFDDASIDVEVAFAQRRLGVAAGVIQRVEGARRR